MSEEFLPSREQVKETGLNVLKGLGILAGIPVGLAAGWIVYSATAIDHNVPMLKALDAKRETFSTPETGLVSTYVDRRGEGRPLVLIHSINAAASAYEMRPIFERFRAVRPMWVPDLPGFGFSERSNRLYSPQLYTQAILKLLETQVGEPADVVALSLGCEFAARAAMARPDLVRSLTMISPSGFIGRGEGRSSQTLQERGIDDMLHKAFSFWVWARPLYDLLTTDVSLRYYLEQSFAGPVDQEWLAYAHTTAHQPDAHYAPLYFISGKLFTPKVLERVYAKLQMPVHVIYDRDPYVSFEKLPALLAIRPHWHATRLVPTMGLPHFDLPDPTVAAMGAFWLRLEEEAEEES